MTVKKSIKEVILMVPIFVILTVVTCIGIKGLTERSKQSHTAKERKIRRSTWALTEESFLKC